MAGKANSKAVENTPAVNVPQTIVCVFKSIKVSGDEDQVLYTVQLDRKIDGIARNRDTDEYEEKEIDYIHFNPSVLIAQTMALVEGVDAMYNSSKETSIRGGKAGHFGSAQLQIIYSGAKVTIQRTKFNKGDEYTDRDGNIQVHENDGYNTDITKVEVTDKVQKLLDKVIENLFFS